MKLTQATTATLTLPDGKSEVITFDDDLPGFGLRIRRGGARSWVYQFKLGTRHRRITLGNAAVLTATQARKTAAELHAMVRLGRDPAGEKAEGRLRAGETMAAAVQAYLALKRGELKPRSYVEVERHLLKHGKPLLGLQLARIDRRTIAIQLTAVTTESGAVSANRMRSSLVAFFGWCVREGMLECNPAIGTNRKAEQSRDRVLTDVELKTVWNATTGDDDYSAIVRLLTLTGQRANEIAALRWSEILEDRIALPASRTKNSRAHSIPITAAARAILDSRPRGGDDFVFGARQGAPFSGWGTRKVALDQRIADEGIEIDHWTHHDLRRTMATWLAESGTSPHIVEALLNHVGGHKAGIAGIYNRASYEPQKRLALEKWAAHVEALATDARPSTVVSLHHRT
jgi:integrase